MYQVLDENLQMVIPPSVSKQSTPQQLAAYTQKVRQYYFNGGPVNNASKKGYVDVSINVFTSKHTFLPTCVCMCRENMYKYKLRHKGNYYHRNRKCN